MHFELTLPIVLALLFVSRSLGAKVVYAAIFAAGVLALFVTFSRGAFLGFSFSMLVCVLVASSRRLISRYVLGALIWSAILISPLIVVKGYDYIATRPEFTSLHFQHVKTGLEMVKINPLTGVGLNNSTMFRPLFTPGGESEIERSLPLHSQWLLVIVETGLVGAALYVLFFLLVIREAWRATTSKDPGVAPFALGILGAYAALGLHCIVDYVGSGSLQALIWFYAGLAMTFSRAQPSIQTKHARRGKPGPLTRYSVASARTPPRSAPR